LLELIRFDRGNDCFGAARDLILRQAHHAHYGDGIVIAFYIREQRGFERGVG